MSIKTDINKLAANSEYFFQDPNFRYESVIIEKESQSTYFITFKIGEKKYSYGGLFRERSQAKLSIINYYLSETKNA